MPREASTRPKTAKQVTSITRKRLGETACRPRPAPSAVRSCKLFTPRHGARQQQVRYVDAYDQQDQPDRAPKNIERAAQHAAHPLLQAGELGRVVRIPIAMVGLELREKDIGFRQIGRAT